MRCPTSKRYADTCQSLRFVIYDPSNTIADFDLYMQATIQAHSHGHTNQDIQPRDIFRAHPRFQSRSGHHHHIQRSQPGRSRNSNLDRVPLHLYESRKKSWICSQRWTKRAHPVVEACEPSCRFRKLIGDVQCRHLVHSRTGSGRWEFEK
jgi:hypothetical protein